MDSLYKILGIINRIIWIIVGLVVLYALIKNGPNVVNSTAGSALGRPDSGQQIAPQPQQGQPTGGQTTTAPGSQGTIVNSPVQDGQGSGQVAPVQPVGNPIVSPGAQNTVK